MTEPKVPTELLIAFGSGVERVKLVKAYLSASPTVRELLYDFFTRDTRFTLTDVSAETRKELKQFPLKVTTAGRLTVLSDKY